jgi:cell division transport system permease protein
MATVFVFMMALLSVDVLLGANVMLAQIVHVFEDRVDVTVSFKVGTPEPIVSQARFYLTSLPQVRAVQLVTAEEALKDFKQRHSTDPKILAALSELSSNPLGAKIVVKAQSTEDYPFLLQAIQNPQYASFIQNQTYDDHKVTIDKVRDVGRNVRLVGAALVAVFALFGLLTMFNAIRVAIYTHREEINIMRLVGASTGYIRAPFLLESWWIAVLGFGLSTAMFLGAVVWIEPQLRLLFEGADPGLLRFFREQGLVVFGLEAAAILSSVTVVAWAAVGRYIKR